MRLPISNSVYVETEQSFDGIGVGFGEDLLLEICRVHLLFGRKLRRLDLGLGVLPAELMVALHALPGFFDELLVLFNLSFDLLEVFALRQPLSLLLVLLRGLALFLQVLEGPELLELFEIPKDWSGMKRAGPPLAEDSVLDLLLSVEEVAGFCSDLILLPLDLLLQFERVLFSLEVEVLGDQIVELLGVLRAKGRVCFVVSVLHGAFKRVLRHVKALEKGAVPLDFAYLGVS